MTVDVVTGAFSYTGQRIAGTLLERGRSVRTLTRKAPGPALANNAESLGRRYASELSRNDGR